MTRLDRALVAASAVAWLGLWVYVAAPLALGQLAGRGWFARAAWRAPPGPVADELRNAVVLAVLPALAWWVLMHPALDRRLVGPEQLMVPAHVAVSLTACAALVGAALAARLARAAPAPTATP